MLNEKQGQVSVLFLTMTLSYNFAFGLAYCINLIIVAYKLP